MNSIFENSTLITSTLALIGVVVTAIISYKVTRQTVNKDMLTTHRLSLSQDEKDFRSDLLAEVKSYRDEIRTLMKEVDSLRDVNAELQVTNSLLAIKIDELTLALNKFNADSSSSTLTSTTHTHTHHEPEVS